MKLTIVVMIVIIGHAFAAPAKEQKPNLSEVAVRPRIPQLPECREDCERRINYEVRKKVEECTELGALPALCNLQGRTYENDGKSKCAAQSSCMLRGIPIRYGIGK